MNTLNNQQINPGNRVDFSRIRRFAKGGIPKYQDAPGKLPYNWDWDGLNTAINGGGFGTATTTSLGYNKTFAPQGDIKTVADLEKSQDYTDFTNYVKQNATTDPKVMEYLKNIDAKSRKAGATTGHLFDASGNLVQGWENVYDGLRNDGMYGAYHYSANKLTPSEDAVDVTERGPADGIDTENTNVTTENTELNNSQTFTPVDFLPQYQKGKWTGWEHLPGMAARNLMTNARNLKLDLQKQVPLAQASQQNEVVTNDYVGRTIMQQQLAEARARNSAAASNTSNADAAREMQLDFESQVAMPAEMQMAQRQSDEFNRTTELAQQKADASTNERTRIANYNREQLAADFNSKLNAKQKYNLNKTQEFNSLSQNLAASKRQYDLQEAYNKDLYNQNVNNFLTLQQQQKAQDQYSTALKDGWKTGTGYEDLYNYLIGGGDDNFTQNQEYVDTLTQNKYDLTKVRPILETLAKDNPQIQAWLDNYDSYASSQKLAYEEAYRQAALRNSWANLFQKQYYTGPNDLALNRNLSTMYPGLGGYYKKGGKVEDRIIKYIEHNRKALKDQSDRVSKAQSEQAEKLARDLDALDRETLMLLRAIFK